MIAALVRHLLESTIFCIVLGMLTYGLRQKAAALRHLMWLISVLKFSIPTALLTATGTWLAYILPAPGWISSLAAKVLAVLSRLFGSLPIHISSDSITYAPFAILIVWVLGSAIMFGHWFSRLRKSYNGLSDASTRQQTALDHVKRRFGFNNAVALHYSSGRNEPALVGVFSPLIAIPWGLSEQLTKSEFEAVLLHELAHAHRHDNLASAFVHCLVCLFWFHPLLWFAERQLIIERERACDEMVIDCGMAPEIYLAGLLKVCKFHMFGAVAGVSPASGSDLRIRFDQILSYRKGCSIPYAVRFAMAGFALSIAFIPIAGGYCEQCVSSGRGITSTRLQDKSQPLQFRTKL